MTDEKLDLSVGDEVVVGYLRPYISKIASITAAGHYILEDKTAFNEYGIEMHQTQGFYIPRELKKATPEAVEVAKRTNLINAIKEFNFDNLNTADLEGALSLLELCENIAE